MPSNITHYQGRGLLSISWLTAGIIRMRVLFEGGSYMRIYGKYNCTTSSLSDQGNTANLSHAGKVQCSTQNFFDRLFLIRAYYWNPKSCLPLWPWSYIVGLLLCDWEVFKKWKQRESIKSLIFDSIEMNSHITMEKQVEQKVWSSSWLLSYFLTTSLVQ